MTRFAWSQLLDHCFESTQYMTLATNSPNGPWVSPLYFSWDEKFNIYFLSQLASQHAQNFLIDPRVACSIFPTNQDTLGRIFGAYATGTVIHMISDDDRKKAEDVFFDRIHPNDPLAKEVNGYRTNPEWQLFKVSLTGLWYMDSEYFEQDGRVPVPESEWKS